MKLTIRTSGEDPDDHLVYYELVAESNLYKTTLGFYEYSGLFGKFAQRLKSFPFEDASPVDLTVGERKGSAYYLELGVSLLDSVGTVAMHVESDDMNGNRCEFTENIEVVSLANLITKLTSANFFKPAEIIWSTDDEV